MTDYPIYMDNHATTPMDPLVLEEMLPYFMQIPGNAASIDHLHGLEAQRAVENARASIAKSIGAKSPEEIIFTSGATESDNIALIGVADAYASKGNHIVISSIEHKAVIDAAKHLETRGLDVSVLPVDHYGLVDPAQLEKTLKKETILVSIMLANNEIGTVQRVDEIGAITREQGVLFHTDAAQAVGHIPVNVENMNIDLMSVSGHKIYGPKGVGVLYAKLRNPRAKPSPIIHGGGHERGMRSGTLNVPAIVGIAKALEIAVEGMNTEQPRLYELSNMFLEQLSMLIPSIERNGHPQLRLPGNLNIWIPGVESRALVLEMNKWVSFSTGSACTTAIVEPSHVIKALGFGEARAHESIRFGLGRWNTKEQIELIIPRLVEASTRISQLAST